MPRRASYLLFLSFVVPRLVDKRSVGRITSQLQDDAARIQAFSGEPVRAMAVALSSVLVGIVLSLVVSFFLIFIPSRNFFHTVSGCLFAFFCVVYSLNYMVFWSSFI
jgi:prolipoprotein diacylglyceryltransferase